MTPTQRVLHAADWICAYCGGRATCADHAIPRVIRKKLRNAGKVVAAELLELVAACVSCNLGKGPRKLVPPSWSRHITALNALGFGRWRVWDGSQAALRVVSR